MIITKIHLENWKNFGEVTVACGKRVFLIGPNASGKSNFLDALRFLRDVAQDGLAKAVSGRGGLRTIRFLGARRPSDVTVAVTLDDRWDYSLSFTANNKSEPVVSREYVALEENGVRKSLLERPDAEDKQDTVRLTQTALEQVNTNKAFRAISDFFASIQYRHILPQLVRDPKSFSPSPSKNDPYGRDIVSQIWNTPVNIRDARLKKINGALAIAVPQFNNLSVELNQSTGVPHLKVNYKHWRANGAYQDESAFSDGTLRLLTLLWSLFDTDSSLLLEEPELSLHEEIIRRLPEIFAKLDKSRKKATRQIFITTHAEAMLSDPGIGGNEVLRCEPGAEGSVIDAADQEECGLMKDGLTAAEVLLPKTRPFNIEQLPLLPL
ncbi:MAG: AAA family ATPase [Deltaproteobacteria bacterium]|jgi:predicted ATPase|nr:AAA family ATPase [Deltaproteobacteria bacterium]